MADTGFYNPKGYNPYDDVLEGKRSDGEGDQKSQDNTEDQNNSTNLLRAAENNALSGNSFYRGGDNGSKNRSSKNKLAGFGKKKGLAVFGVIMLLIVGFGIFLGSTHTLLGPAISNKTLEMDPANAAQEMEMANTLACLSSGECEGELSDDVIASLEANGIEVGEDKKSLSYNGQDISGDQLIEILNTNVGVRAAVNDATLSNVGSILDETGVEIDNDRGITKNLFVDAEQTNNIEKDIEKLNETANTKFENQIQTTTHTQKESYNYKKKKISSSSDETCDVDEDGNCTDNEDEKVMASHTTTNNTASASTTAKDKAEATNEASSYIAKISEVSKMSSWGCSALRLGQLLSTTAANNEKQQSLQTYSVTMENISKMMAGYGSETYYHAVMTKLIEPTTIEVADYASPSLPSTSAIEDATVEIGTKTMTGSAVDSQALNALLTDSSVSANEASNFSLERTNSVLNDSLIGYGIDAAKCNLSQQSGKDDSKSGLEMLAPKNNSTPLAELITRGTSIAVSTMRGSGTTQTSGGLAWAGTKSTSTILGKIVKKFFVNVNLNNYIQFMAPAFGSTSYANANEIYSGIESGEAIVRGAYTYFSGLGAAGSGQSGADETVSTAYNKLTKTVLAKQAEVDRYNRSPFDISSPNTFLGSIVYSFIPLATSSTANGISSLIRNTGTSISSLMGVASAAADYNYGENGRCDRLKDINSVGDPFCNPRTVTDPSVLQLSHSDAEYNQYINSGVDSSGVIEGSNLAKYMSYCAWRQSPPGILDENISEELDENRTPLNKFMRRIQSIFGFLTASFSDDESGWVDYSSCVASENNPKWEENKYYSLWMLQQRQLIQLGVVKYDESPLTAYKRKYEEKHPINDYTDYIARVNGFSREDAQLVLDTIAYYTFLDGYNPTERIAMEESVTDTMTSAEAIAKIESEDQRLGDGEKEEPILNKENYIVYADIRNRSYTV